MDAKQIIKRLGGGASLAKKLGLTDKTGATAVRAWLCRNSIPGAWFADVARVAAAEGHSDITVEALALLARQRAGRVTPADAVSEAAH